MDTSIKILSVDDNQVNQKLIVDALKHHFHLDVAMTPTEALSKLKQKTYEVLLLDVNMPEMNGYELCQTIRTQPDYLQTPIIFISALTDAKDRLKGYEAGGNDYICKPIDLNELKHKVDLAVVAYQERLDLDEQLDAMSKTAFSIMENNGELGVLIKYLEQGNTANDTDALLVLTTETIQELGLSACIRARFDDVSYFANTDAQNISPLEEELLKQGEGGARIVTCGKRTLYNDHHVSILVRDMPLDDEELAGRLRDHLAILVNACNSRLEIIKQLTEQKASRNTTISSSMQDIEVDMKHLHDDFEVFKSDISVTISEIQHGIEEVIPSFGLTDEQEGVMFALLGKGDEKIQSVLDWATSFDKQLENLSSSVFSSLSASRDA